MTAKELLEIIQTRMKCIDDNPTSKSLLFEIYTALERLDRFEEKEK